MFSIRLLLYWTHAKFVIVCSRVQRRIGRKFFHFVPSLVIFEFVHFVRSLWTLFCMIVVIVIMYVEALIFLAYLSSISLWYFLRWHAWHFFLCTYSSRLPLHDAKARDYETSWHNISLCNQNWLIDVFSRSRLFWIAFFILVIASLAFHILTGTLSPLLLSIYKCVCVCWHENNGNCVAASLGCAIVLCALAQLTKFWPQVDSFHCFYFDNILRFCTFLLLFGFWHWIVGIFL